jgi:anti-sigma-K factor RskA
MKIVATGAWENISKPLTVKLVQKGHGVMVISSNPEKRQAIESLGPSPRSAGQKKWGYAKYWWQVWVFAAAGAVALFIALLTISYQTAKAAFVNPAQDLRSDV